MTAINFSMGSVTTLTVVALIGDVGREHVAVATSCEATFRSPRVVLIGSKYHTLHERQAKFSGSHYPAP